jgi:AraC-like DNA-binding protein
MISWVSNAGTNVAQTVCSGCPDRATIHGWASLHEVSTERQADVAYAAGFTDQAHMINDFTKIVGVPPAQLVRLPCS